MEYDMVLKWMPGTQYQFSRCHVAPAPLRGEGQIMTTFFRGSCSTGTHSRDLKDPYLT